MPTAPWVAPPPPARCGVRIPAPVLMTDVKLTREEQHRVALEALITQRSQRRVAEAQRTGRYAQVQKDVTWYGAGRELRVAPLIDNRWDRIVACLNIWNDAAALKETMATWAEHVDAFAGSRKVNSFSSPIQYDL